MRCVADEDEEALLDLWRRFGHDGWCNCVSVMGASAFATRYGTMISCSRCGRCVTVSGVLAGAIPAVRVDVWDVDHEGSVARPSYPTPSLVYLAADGTELSRRWHFGRYGYSGEFADRLAAPGVADALIGLSDTYTGTYGELLADAERMCGSSADGLAPL